MNKIKLILSAALMFVVLFAQTGNVAAAPLAQTATSITGTITALSCTTDANTSVNTFVVTVQAADGTTQTVTISQQTAIDLGLVTADANNSVNCTDPAVQQQLQSDVNTTVSIDSSTVIPNPTTDEQVNPISTILGMFFGVDAAVIEGYHTDGNGFGVIAQALWMSKDLGGDASLAGDILQAKKDKDFAAFFAAHPELLADGQTVPTNWGQFRKAVSGKKENLGTVVSGNTDSTNQGNGNNNGNNGKDNGNNGKGHGNGHNKP
jgi:hypothetical protein